MRNAALAISLLLFLVSTPETHAQTAGPEEAYFNVYQIQVSGVGTGTAFTMAVDGRQYMVTAKHMVSTLKTDGSPQSIEILAGDYGESIAWKPLKVRIFACADPIDIAVMITDDYYGRSKSRDATESFFGEQSLLPRPAGGPALGQEGYFIGFPFGYAPAKGSAGPLPFTKKATLSINFWDGNADRMYFDGYNNPGFSGAPVLFQDPNDVRPYHSHFYVSGVVSGFIPQLVNTANWRRVKPNESLAGIEKWRLKTEHGSKYVLEDTETVVPLNTGIIVAFNIRHAVELIESHPIGPEIPAVHLDPWSPLSK